MSKTSKLTPVINDIGADSFHNIKIFGESIVVVIDRGLNKDHPDLKDNIMTGMVGDIECESLMKSSIEMLPLTIERKKYWDALSEASKAFEQSEDALGAFLNKGDIVLFDEIYAENINQQEELAIKEGEAKRQRDDFDSRFWSKLRELGSESISNGHASLILGSLVGKGYGVAPNAKVIFIDHDDYSFDQAFDIILKLSEHVNIDAVNISAALFEYETFKYKSTSKELLKEKISLITDKNIPIFYASGNGRENYLPDFDESGTYKFFIDLEKASKELFIFCGNMEYIHEKDSTKIKLADSSAISGLIKNYIATRGNDLYTAKYIGGNEVCEKGGTSCAAPIVCGSYLLIKDYLKTEGFSNADATKLSLLILRKTAIKFDETSFSFTEYRAKSLSNLDSSEKTLNNNLEELSEKVNSYNNLDWSFSYSLKHLIEAIKESNNWSVEYYRKSIDTYYQENKTGDKVESLMSCVVELLRSRHNTEMLKYQLTMNAKKIFGNGAIDLAKAFDFLASSNKEALALDLVNANIFAAEKASDLYDESQISSFLTKAITAGNIYFVENLLNKNANVNGKDYNDYWNTPIQTAVCFEQIEIVKLLLSNNANVNVENFNGSSVFDMVEIVGNAEILQLFQEYSN